MKKIISTISTDSKGVHTMKKTLLVLALATVLVFSFATVSSAVYKSYSQKSAYLSWSGANALAGADQVTPHGGYTQSTVKCAVCHSTHRAYSATASSTITNSVESSAIGVGLDNSLLAGANSCAACHAAWGANSAGNTLVELGQTSYGPHFGSGNCMNRACHGSIHGSGDVSKYAAVRKYNLNGAVTVGAIVPGRAALDSVLDSAIASGNTNGSISTTATGRAMKAYVTGYTCAQCHNSSSFVVAVNGAVNQIAGVKNVAQGPGDAVSTVGFRTGHPSVGQDGWGIYVPTCETCHDVVGVATKSTAWPHTNRGIDVYKGRYEEEAGGANGFAAASTISTVITTDNTDATRYGLWMTSGMATDNGTAYGARAEADATPIVGDPAMGYNLRDGACTKCHVPALLP